VPPVGIGVRDDDVLALQAADTLAKTAFSSRTSAVWDDNAPDFISSYIVNDATVI
jgi:hypothetical protein